jgi:long-chain acyl-CoA synthetase
MAPRGRALPPGYALDLMAITFRMNSEGVMHMTARGPTHTLAELPAPWLNPGSAELPQVQGVGGQPLTRQILLDARSKVGALGGSHGERVIVLATSTVETLSVMMACWELGMVVCPLPPDTSEHALARTAKDCGARHVLPGSGRARPLLEPGPAERPRLKFRTPPRVTGNDLALIIYTSGSTSEPKGIMLSHANVLSALRSISQYLALGPQDTILGIPPLYFDYGLYQFLLACQVGCSLALMPANSTPLQIAGKLKSRRITVVPVVPALATRLVQLCQRMHFDGLDTVRLITNTGGHLPHPTITALRTVFPNARIMPMYGLSESKRALFIDPADVDRKPGSVGGPMPGMDAKVMLGEQGLDGVTVWREADVDEVGTLWVRSPSVMQGYTQGEGGGATLMGGAYRDDTWLVTGDLFSVDAEGYFYFRGRSKDLIKQSGFCLYPRDIEKVVDEHPEVHSCAVVGVQDPQGDEYACLFVHGSHQLDKSELLKYIRGRLDVHYAPRRIELQDSWPTNANGKLDRAVLKRRLMEEER